MTIKINHSWGSSAVNKIFENEGIEMQSTLAEHFFELLGKICTYEEEEQKIKPLLIVGKELNTFFAQCPLHYKLVMYEDNLEGKSFARIIKAMVPLCKNNWYIFVNISKDKILYGIFRKFNSPTSVGFEDLFFDKSIKDNKEKLRGMVCIKPYEKNSFIIKSLCSDDTIISFSFRDINEQMENKLINMKNDIICSLKQEEKSYIDKSLTKMFLYMPNKLHGALCLIVTEDYEYPNEYLRGISLEPKLDLIDAIITTETINKYEDAEKYYALTNLVYEFMNVDGITILNNKGEIIGYNAFYRSNNMPVDETGGARKRTFAGLKQEMEKENSNILGVYYQSQDGNFDYELSES